MSWQVPREAGFCANISHRPCCFVGPNLLACYTGRRCITLVDIVDGGGEEATRAVKQLTWQPLDEQPAGAGAVYPALSAHPSRQELLLSAAGWGMIKIWDVNTGLCATTVTGFDSTACAALWAGDSKVVATVYSLAGDICHILRWDLGGGGCVPLPTLVAKATGSDSGLKNGSRLACSSDGHLVAANTWRSCNVLLWDTRIGNEMTQEFKDDGGEKGGGFSAVALDGSGRIAASLDSGAGTLRTWDIRTGRLLARVGGMCGGDYASLALNDAGTAALCCIGYAHDDEEDQRSRGGVYDLVLGRWASSWQRKDGTREPVGICCTRDLGSVAAWHKDGSASVWRLLE